MLYLSHYESFPSGGKMEFMELFKKFLAGAIFSLIGLSGQLSAQSWYGGESTLDVGNPDLSSMLLNNLEIMSIQHDEPTKIHPRAHLSVRSNTDRSAAVQDPNHNEHISYFRNAVHNDFGKHAELNADNSIFIENYAGYDKESNFSFSTRVERETTNKTVVRIIEVLTEGKMIDNRQYFETQLMGFNSKKLETFTYCSGFLYRAPVEGKMRRLYRKKDGQYNQAKFNCKTLTRPLCNSVYRGEQTNKLGRYDGTAFFDALEKDIIDLANYQQIQKSNMLHLKKADKPGGRLHRTWPTDPYLQHYSGMGENGTVTQREARWVVEECKEKMAYFHDPFNRIEPPDDNPNNPSNPSYPSEGGRSPFGIGKSNGSPNRAPSSFSSN